MRWGVTGGREGSGWTTLKEPVDADSLKAGETG